MRRVQIAPVAGALLVSLGLAGSVFAQQPAQVAGAWEMTTEGRRGAITQTLTIQQDGGKITGTLAGPANRSFNLEGTVEGSKISFTVTRQTGRGTFTTTYGGTVDGDAMKGTASMGRFSINWTAKRQH